jgi:hypothetical protein
MIADTNLRTSVSDDAKSREPLVDGGGLVTLLGANEERRALNLLCLIVIK